MAEKIKLYLISFSNAYGTFLTEWCLEMPNCNPNLFSVVSESFFFLPDGVSVGNLFGLRLLYDSNGFYFPLYTQCGKPFVCTSDGCYSLKQCDFI